MVLSKAVLSLLLLAAAVQCANFTTLSAALADAEKFILKLKNASNVPAISLGISVKGRTVWTKAWGYADLENDVPVKVTTRFRLASLSKSFTSAFIGSLVDRGLIHYNDSVHKYLKAADFPMKSWKGKPVTITIGQLLSHTAGTTADSDFDTVVLAQNVTECIHKYKNEPLIFEPGTAFAYSNYGFQLLGAVIESVTGKPYDKVMTAFIRAHELKETVIETTYTPLILDRARYYQPANRSAPRVNIPSSVSDELYKAEASWSDGNVVSNVPELLHYGNLLLNSYHGRQPALVSKATITSMWTSHTAGMRDLGENKPADPYGYAWFLYNETFRESFPFELKHRHYVTHGGTAAGLVSWMNIYPSEEMVVVGLSNKGGFDELGQAVVYTAENVARVALQ